MPRLQTLLLELQDTNSAIAILDSAIQEEKRNASQLVCDSVKPEVNPLAKTFATAYLDLYKAHCEYSNFLDEVERWREHIFAGTRMAEFSWELP